MSNEKYTWVFHAEGKNPFSENGNQVLINRPKAALRMDILTPENLTRRVRPYP
ncbi:hypothetical protein LCGC14_2474770, partial [marine sediment metagenome]